MLRSEHTHRFQMSVAQHSGPHTGNMTKYSFADKSMLSAHFYSSNTSHLPLVTDLHLGSL